MLCSALNVCSLLVTTRVSSLQASVGDEYNGISWARPPGSNVLMDAWRAGASCTSTIRPPQRLYHHLRRCDSYTVFRPFTRQLYACQWIRSNGTDSFIRSFIYLLKTIYKTLVRSSLMMGSGGWIASVRGVRSQRWPSSQAMNHRRHYPTTKHPVCCHVLH